MCSGCSGDYEGDGDQDNGGPMSAPADLGETVDGEPVEPVEPGKAAWPAALRTQMHRHERDEARNQRATAGRQAESEYEVFVSADEIIEIRRIAGNFAGL